MMGETNKTLSTNKTANFFYRLSLIVYLCGLPNFWIKDFNLPKIFLKTYNYVTKLLNIVLYPFIILELGAFFTQKDMSERQKSDLLLYGISHPILWICTVIIMNKHYEVRTLFSNILELQKVYNDKNVQQMMISKSIRYSTGLIFCCVSALILYTVDALWQFILKHGNFSTVITAWPDIHDESGPAVIGRLVGYVFWWILMSRVFSVFVLVVCLTICLSHQFINLQSYFYSLSDIFEMDDLNQQEKELKYEEVYKVGIKLHSNILRCIDQTKVICKGVFSGHIVFNTIVVVILMSQVVMSDRSPVKTLTAAFAACAVLIITGLYMWNAGDITVEASHLATAMYFSGWHNCQKQSSVRIRKMLVMTMMHAQKPVVLKGLGIIDLSYQSYLSIVKSSYTVFSVLY